MTAVEFDLRFAVLTHGSGKVEMRYFRNPRDCEGVMMRLSQREARMLGAALTTPGFVPVARDEAPDLQIYLPLGKEAA